MNNGYKKPDLKSLYYDNEMEAVNPIAIFMAFGALIWFVDDSFNFGMFNLFLPYLLIIFYALILIGLNHYFGWIRVKK